ncbi:MAG: hypothetical protein H6817_04370 [Phycisphaerales bacterium]|nr:hypothetical protein [Phycisphaerales bacterium]
MGVLAVALVMGLSADAFAGPGCSKSKVRTVTMSELTDAGSADNAAVDTAVDRVMESLPKMTYKVGDTETCCSKMAAAKSAEIGAPVQYVVAGETYASREEAMNKLAEAIQAELPKVATVSHVVDGESLSCPKAAAALAAEHHSKVAHLVAGVEFDCPHAAQSVADSLAAKLKESNGCAKAFAANCAKSGGCSKSAAAATASAKEGGCCSKSKAAAETASAKEAGGCSKSAGGCSKAAAATASAETGGCCKKAKAAAEAAAQTASAEPVVEDVEETPQLANAKLLVREIVEFVAASRAS